VGQFSSACYSTTTLVDVASKLRDQGYPVFPQPLRPPRTGWIFLNKGSLEANPYVPTNGPAVGDLFDLFDFHDQAPFGGDSNG